MEKIVKLIYSDDKMQIEEGIRVIDDQNNVGAPIHADHSQFLKKLANFRLGKGPQPLSHDLYISDEEKRQVDEANKNNDYKYLTKQIAGGIIVAIITLFGFNLPNWSSKN